MWYVGYETGSGLQLPFWALMLLKPCKVKRFLATAALSEVGLVTASSDSEEKREDGTDKKERQGKVNVKEERNEEEIRK